MQKYAKLTVVLFVAMMFLAIWTMSGCKKPEVGSPGYQDPSADSSAFKPADEFKYLLDIDAASERIAKIEESGEKPTDFTDMGPADLIAGMAEESIVQKNITAQANDKMVHVTGEYSLADLGLTDEENPLKYLADVGAAEVKLPNHYPAERYMGHLFIANLDDIIEKLVTQAAEESKADTEKGADDPMSMMGGDFESGLAFLGISTKEEIYDWIGDELIMFSISNPGYDPEAELTPENTPSHSILAIASDAPDKGLELVSNLMGSFMVQMMGYTSEESEITGHKAITLVPPDMENNPMYKDMDEETKAMMMEQMGPMGEMPPIVMITMPGYVMIGDQQSVDAAVAAFTEEASGTGRMANVEVESNWDIAINNFSPSNPGVFLEMLESDELRDLLARFAAESANLEELGATRLSMVARDGQNFDIDLETSRESIKLLEIVRQIVSETDEPTWAALGEQFGKMMAGEQASDETAGETEEEQPAGEDEGSATEKPKKGEGN